MPSPSHSSRFYHPKNIGWPVQIIKLLIMQFSLLPCHLVPLRPNILLNTLLSNTLNLRLISLFCWLGRTKVAVHVQSFLHDCLVTICFYGEELLAPRPTLNLEDHPLSAVSDCLFNIFAATMNIGGRSYTRNLRTRRALVTGSHLSWKCDLYKKVYCYVHIVCYLWLLVSETQQINLGVGWNSSQRQSLEDTSRHEQVVVVLEYTQQMSR